MKTNMEDKNMPELSKPARRSLRPDAQAFDEVRITTNPRWKESELSGDEWRISGHIQFLRKGKICHERSFRNVETACGFAYAEYMRGIDEGKAYFAGEGDICDQEGCAEPATIAYQKKFDYNSDGDKKEIKYSTEVRKFCKKHSCRGDCGLDDADDNYEPYIAETVTA